LNGSYTYQITAFNNYGSASTGKKSITITITLGSNQFSVQGSGFTHSNPVKVGISASVSGQSAPETSLTADSGGRIKTVISCQPLCTTAGAGSQLQFQATDTASGQTSNTALTNCAKK
jgi:hypothetical protein